jgi:hypothetical protein
MATRLTGCASWLHIVSAAHAPRRARLMVTWLRNVSTGHKLGSENVGLSSKNIGVNLMLRKPPLPSPQDNELHP